MSFLKWLFYYLLYPFRQWFKSADIYGYQFVSDKPDRLKAKTVYVIGTRESPWQVAFICPCGCKSVIELFTNRQTRPRWDIRFEKKTVTLYPSVHRTAGCKAHFFLTSGKVNWCD